MKLEHESLTLAERDVHSYMLRLLRERVFHITSQLRYERICDEGFITPNSDGSLGDTYPQSRVSLGRRRGYVCLFHLRNQTDRDVEYGLGCFGSFARPPLVTISPF